MIIARLQKFYKCKSFFLICFAFLLKNVRNVKKSIDLKLGLRFIVIIEPILKQEEKRMDFWEVLKNRYACKKFDGRQVAAEHLDVILEAGRLAPTAKNLQEQRIYVVQSEEGLVKIDKVTPCRYGAPTAIVVAFDKNNVFVYPGEQRDSGIEDASIVATHMMLAAKAVGVDSCWINFFDPEAAAKELGLPDNEEVLMILDIGYAAEDTKPLATHTQRRELSETVTYM